MTEEEALALREEILDTVIQLYRASSVDAPWTEMPPHISDLAHEIYDLVTKACGIKE